MSVERKYLRVSREDEANTIEEYSYFGWQVASSQDVYSQGVDIQYDLMSNPWLVTSTVDYVKLILERDTDMPHYEELKELENTYFANMNMYIDYYGTTFGIGRGILVGFLFLLGFGAFAEPKGIIPGIICILIGILIIVFRRKKIKKNNMISQTGLQNAADAMNKAQEIYHP